MGCGTSKDDCTVSSITETSRFGVREQDNFGDILYLEKGGLQVKTRIGSIQYGIPPETLKDSLNQGFSVPEYYIIFKRKFDFADGINLMEFEFPVYYNFFLRKQNRTKMICDRHTRQQILEIFQETLLGPKDLSRFHEDFIEGYEAIPSIKKELEYFAKNPFNQTQPLTADLLIEFILFDDENIAEFSKAIKNDAGEEEKITIKIHQTEGFFHLYENGKLLSKFEEVVKLDESKFQMVKTTGSFDGLSFDPPEFGVTVLGSSHGFDCSGSTSGFILWIDKRGVMVDPPPYSSRALRMQHIPPNLIEKVIITHCHADHDSGAFHKIVESTPIEFVTTSTILGSFLRKYSAILDMSIKEITELFQHRTVYIGHPTFICGARFVFEYSFHSIPALCFSVEYKGKKFFFSGDTCYDPERLRGLYEKGLFSTARYKALAERDFSKYDLIFHEAGIPPIHTPVTVLAALPEEVKKKVFLMHIAAKDIPLNIGLNSVGSSLDTTHHIIENVSERNPTNDNLDLLCSLDIIQWVPFNRISEIINCLKEEHFEAGDIIIQAGEQGDRFYIVKKGSVRVFSEDKDNAFVKIYIRGDYFGESALTDQPERKATIIANTEVDLVSINKYDFEWVFKYQIYEKQLTMNPLDMIQNLAGMRRTKTAEFINENRSIARMNENQKSIINMYIETVEVKPQQVLWSFESQPDACYIIKTGKYLMKAPKHKVPQNFMLKPGAMIGDFGALLNDTPASSEVICTTTGVLFKISKDNINFFLKTYPGFYVLCKDNYIIV